MLKEEENCILKLLRLRGRSLNKSKMAVKSHIRLSFKTSVVQTKLFSPKKGKKRRCCHVVNSFETLSGIHLLVHPKCQQGKIYLQDTHERFVSFFFHTHISTTRESCVRKELFFIQKSRNEIGYVVLHIIPFAVSVWCWTKTVYYMVRRKIQTFTKEKVQTWI